MAKIIGGALNFEFTADLEKLKKTLDNGKGHLKGFTEIAEQAGIKLDNALSGHRDMDALFSQMAENAKSQAKFISDLETQYRTLNQILKEFQTSKSGGFAEEKKELKEIDPLLEEYKNKYEELRTQMVSMQQDMQRTGEVRKQEIESLRGQADAYRAALEDLKRQIENAVDGKKITTEVSGIISTVDEMSTSAGRAVLEMSKMNEVNFDFGISRENIKIQKQAIEDLKKQIDELQDKAKGTAPGMAQAGILSQIGPLKAELAAEERALIELQSELGKTEQKQISLTTARNQALDAMRKLTLENKQGTDEYKAAEQAVIDYNKAIEQTNAQAKMLSAGGLSGIIQNMSVATGLLSTGVAVAGLFSSENENLNRIMLKTQALLSATITLQQLQQSVTTKGIFGITSLTAAKNAWAATNLRVATTLGITTVAAQALMGVLTLGLTVAIGAVIYAWSKLSEKQAEQVKMNKAIADSLAGPLVAYKTLQAQWNALGNDLNAKKKFITENKDEFQDLGVKVGDVSEAERFLVSQSANFEKAMMLRAEAAATAQIAMEKFKESIIADREIQDFDKNWSESGFFGKVGLSAQAIFTGLDHKKGANLKAEAEQLIKEQADLMKRAEELAKKAANPYTGSEKKPDKNKPLAEIFDEESILKLRQQISLMDAALDRMGKNGEVRLRALDKYGKEYATKEVTTRENAVKMREELAERLAEAEKRIMIQSFDELLEQTRKHMALRDELLQQGYSKDNIDALFPEVKDKSFIQYLEETENALSKLMDSGKGKEETAENLQKIRQEIEKYRGHESYIEGVKKSIEELTNSFTGSELISNLKRQLALTAGETTEQEEAERKRIYEKAIQEEEIAIKQRYQNILKEQQSFEEQRIALAQKYADLYALAQTQAEKSKIDKAQKAETSQLQMDILQSTADWQMAFGDMEFVSQSALKRIEAALLRFKEVMGDTLQPTELRELEEALKRVRDAQTSNLFTSVVSGLRNLKIANDEVRIATEEYNATLDANGNETEKSAAAANKLAQADMKAAAAKQKLIEDLRKSQGIFNAVGEAVIELGNAFGFMDEEMSKTIGNLVELGNAAFDFAASVSSGDVAGMIRAGAKIITSIANLFNDDDKKERNIARYTEELRELERVFESLNRTISKSLGEDYFDVSQAAIDNLRQQQEKLRKMIEEESGKKGADQEKIQGYYNQIAAIDNAIEGMMQSMADKILAGMDAQSIMDKLSDALVSAFENGEDAALAMGRTVDQMLRDMVINALKMQILAPEIKKVVDKIMSSLGFDSQGNGSFDGLTEEERAKIKEMLTNASNQFTSALQEYEDLFGAAAGNAVGMKGDIKGITEKTAGALESQINAIRMHQAEQMKTAKLNHAIFVESLKNLVMIEYNTRRLHSIDDGIKELNAKINKKLAGVP